MVPSGKDQSQNLFFQLQGAKRREHGMVGTGSLGRHQVTAAVTCLGCHYHCCWKHFQLVTARFWFAIVKVHPFSTFGGSWCAAAISNCTSTRPLCPCTFGSDVPQAVAFGAWTRYRGHCGSRSSMAQFKGNKNHKGPLFFCSSSAVFIVFPQATRLEFCLGLIFGLCLTAWLCHFWFQSMVPPIETLSNLSWRTPKKKRLGQDSCPGPGALIAFRIFQMNRESYVQTHRAECVAISLVMVWWLVR